MSAPGRVWVREEAKLKQGKKAAKGYSGRHQNQELRLGTRLWLV